MIKLSQPDHDRIIEIRNSLKLIGPEESSFANVEQLFYEAISISRNYENNGDNILLASLKRLEHVEYKVTQSHFNKRNQREQAIRKFITGLKKILQQKFI